MGKARLEIDNVKRQMLQQEIAFNIQQTDALTRLVITVGDKDMWELVEWASPWSLNWDTSGMTTIATTNTAAAAANAAVWSSSLSLLLLSLFSFLPNVLYGFSTEYRAVQNIGYCCYVASEMLFFRSLLTFPGSKDLLTFPCVFIYSVKISTLSF